MSFHRLSYHPLDGPLDPEEAAGGWWDLCPECDQPHDPEDECEPE